MILISKNIFLVPLVFTQTPSIPVCVCVCVLSHAHVYTYLIVFIIECLTNKLTQKLVRVFSFKHEENRLSY